MIKYNPATGDVEDDGADGSTLPIGAVTQAAAPITPVSAGAVTQAVTQADAQVNPYEGFFQQAYTTGQEQKYIDDLRNSLDRHEDGPEGGTNVVGYKPKTVASYTPEQAVDLYNKMDPSLANDPAMLGMILKGEGYWKDEGHFAPGQAITTADNFKAGMKQWDVDQETRANSWASPRNLAKIAAVAVGGYALAPEMFGAGAVDAGAANGAFLGESAWVPTVAGESIIPGAIADVAAASVAPAAQAVAEKTIMEQLATQFGKQFTMDALGKTALKNAAIQLATTGKIDIGKLATSALLSPITGTISNTVTGGMDPGWVKDAAAGAVRSGTTAALTGGNVINSALAGGVIGAATPLINDVKTAGSSAWDKVKDSLGFGNSDSAAIADADKYWTDNPQYRDGAYIPEEFGANDRRTFVNSNDTDGGVDGAVPLEIDHRGYIFDPASGDPVGYQFPDGRTQWVTMDGDGNVTSGKLGGVMDDSTGVISYPDGTVESPQSVDFSTSGNPTTVNGAISYADSNDARGISTDDTGVVALPNGTVVNPDGTVANKKTDAAGNTTNTTNTTNITSISPAKQREMYAATAPPIDWSAFYAAYKALVENNKRAS